MTAPAASFLIETLTVEISELAKEGASLMTPLIARVIGNKALFPETVVTLKKCCCYSMICTLFKPRVKVEPD